MPRSFRWLNAYERPWMTKTGRREQSHQPVGLSSAARVAVWITFAAVVVIGFWFGLQSGLG